MYQVGRRGRVSLEIRYEIIVAFSVLRSKKDPGELGRNITT